MKQKTFYLIQIPVMLLLGTLFPQSGVFFVVWAGYAAGRYAALIDVQSPPRSR